VEEFGKTSDGTSKRIYAARFDIDMAKCCFCGLCTTVCPTECLVMTPEYDVPVIDLTKLNFGFGNMTEAEAETKRKEWEFEKSRKAEAAASATSDSKPAPSRPMRASPSMPAASKAIPEKEAQPSSPVEPENQIRPIKSQSDSNDAE
jgi:NADH-quinone oxidoreductase subunit I